MEICKTPTTPLGRLNLFPCQSGSDISSGPSSTYSSLSCDSGPSSLSSSQISDSGPSSLSSSLSCDSGPSSLSSSQRSDSGRSTFTSSQRSDSLNSRESGYFSISVESDTTLDDRLDKSNLDNTTGRPLSQNYPCDKREDEPRRDEHGPLFASLNRLPAYGSEQKILPVDNNNREDKGSQKRSKSKSNDVQPNKRTRTIEYAEIATSEIVIDTKSGTRNAGFSIRTEDCRHRIMDVGDLYYPDLKLKDNDEIIAIQDVEVVSWDHCVLTNFLKHVFDQPIQNPTLTLIIKRDDADIMISIDFTEMDTSAKELLMRINRKVLYTIRPLRTIRLVEYQGERTCMIRHRNGNSDYLYFKADGDKIKLDHCTHDDNEKMYHFKRHYFHGHQNDQNNQIQFVLFCVFVSVESKKVLSLKGLTKVGLMDQPLNKSIRCLTQPDPRFFRTDRTSSGTTVRIDSLVYPGLYIARRQRKLILTCDPDPDEEDVQFEINDTEQLPSRDS